MLSPFGSRDMPDLFSHPESWVEDKDLTSVIPPYRKTYSFKGEFINGFHKSLADHSSTGVFSGPIKGSLRKADALKLYELGYFAPGGVLELGTYHGLLHGYSPTLSAIQIVRDASCRWISAKNFPI